MPPRAAKPDWKQTLPAEAKRLRSDDPIILERFRELIDADDIDAPRSVKRAYQAFRFLLFYGCILREERRFPALNRCWDDLQERFGRYEVFDDGVFIESWVLIDFPLDATGRTVLDEFAAFCEPMGGATAEFAPFIASARASRFGLHQEIRSTSRTTKYKELFTGRITSTLRSVADYEPKEIFLGRIIELDGDRFLLGDPKNWPSAAAFMLVDAVEKRLIEVPGSDTLERFELLMKLGGPYWMSCVCGSDADEVLSPAHWQRYHNDA